MGQLRDFKGIWIPKEIWLDSRLNALDKIILAEIDSLDNEDGCFASNEYLAEFCQCSERKVSEAISKLIKTGYIVVKNFDGRRRTLQSCIAKNESLPRKNCEADSQKSNAINIDINNIEIKENNIKEKFIKPSLEEIKAYCQERNNGINPNSFYDFYESKNWMIGKNRMKDWKAAVRTWEQRSKPIKKVVQTPDWYDRYKNELKEKSEQSANNEPKNEKLDINELAKGLFGDE